MSASAALARSGEKDDGVGGPLADFYAAAGTPRSDTRPTPPLPSRTRGCEALIGPAALQRRDVLAAEEDLPLKPATVRGLRRDSSRSREVAFGRARLIVAPRVSRREVHIPRQAPLARQQMTIREESLHALEGGCALVGDQRVAEPRPGVMPAASDGGRRDEAPGRPHRSRGREGAFSHRDPAIQRSARARQPFSQPDWPRSSPYVCRRTCSRALKPA
jgi:hypothetical protein